MTTEKPAAYITTESALHTWCRAQKTCTRIAIDSEFMRVRTFYPIPCLLQLSTDDSDVIVDVQTVDCAPLRPLLEDARIQKIFHSQEQDIEVIRLLLPGVALCNIYDTQIAAAFCCYGSQVGLARLINQLFDYEMVSMSGRFDWSQRPLPEEALRYATDDSKWLLPLVDALHEQLTCKGYAAFVPEESAATLVRFDEKTRHDQVWRHVRGHGDLSPQQQSVLCTLAAWRETVAQEKNRPRNWIVKNEQLSALAVLQPKTQTALKKSGLLSDKLCERWGDAILDAVATGYAQYADKTWHDAVPHFNGRARMRIGKWRTTLNAVAERAAVDKTLFFDKNDLKRLVREQDNRFTTAGWRKTLYTRFCDETEKTEKIEKKTVKKVPVTAERTPDSLHQLLTQYFQEHHAFVENGALGNLFRLVTEEAARSVICYVLDHTEGNMTQTAKVLGISRTTLMKKIADFRIRTEDAKT